MSYYYDGRVDFSDLKGKTLISTDGLRCGSEEVDFTTACGKKYRMYHSQDCCERVRIEDVSGDWQCLIGSPIELAYEETNRVDDPPEYPDSFTWTFYRLATANGYVVIRWLGESNGYYSESVDFADITDLS